MLKKYMKTLILTSLVMLIPIIVVLILWNKLPDSIPSTGASTVNRITGVAKALLYSVFPPSCW